uniref:Uncharacterized LOC103042156 n=1 Tax=Astyanax mexicanus TaxID=7994 RepID=A0A8B9KW50_ASTMX
MASSVFLSFSIIFTILQGLTLITSGNCNETELNCIPSIRVPRNTVWTVSENTTLKINCTIDIKSNCWQNLVASWCRINDKNECLPMNQPNHTATEWRNISGDQQMFILIFWNLSKQDAGLYRCLTHAPVSTSGHTIRVNVTDGTREESSDMAWLWPYVYISSGIIVLVLTVIVVALLLLRCRGSKERKQRKEQIAENQFSVAHTPSFSPRVRSTLQPGNTHSLPPQLSPTSDLIYGNAPIRASSQKDRHSRGHPANHAAKPRRGHDHFTEELEDEDNPLVYASLNHKVMPRPPVRVTLPEETSEYAAIRVS